MVPLSSLTKKRLSEVFAPNVVGAAVLMIESECGDNLPLMQGASPEQLERIRLAVLRLSRGNMDRLKSACELAKVDSRDALVAAGFGDDAKAHLAWDPKALN